MNQEVSSFCSIKLSMAITQKTKHRSRVSFFLLFFPFSSGLEASSRKTKVRAASSAKASSTEIPVPARALPWVKTCAQKQWWHYGSRQKLGLTISLLQGCEFLFWVWLFARLMRLANIPSEKESSVWCWKKIFPLPSCMGWWYSQDFYALFLVANPVVLPRVGSILQAVFPELAKQT